MKCLQANSSTPHCWKIHIVSGNGFVPSANKPLPEPMLIWSLGDNELNKSSTNTYQYWHSNLSTVVWQQTYMHWPIKIIEIWVLWQDPILNLCKHVYHTYVPLSSFVPLVTLTADSCAVCVCVVEGGYIFEELIYHSWTIVLTGWTAFYELIIAIENTFDACCACLYKVPFVTVPLILLQAVLSHSFTEGFRK